MSSSAQPTQSPHWLDQVTEDILRWQKEDKVQKLHVDDMKTPSGRVHTGALRGVILHDLIAKALEQKAKGVVSTYVFNDLDPMDSMPGYLDKDVYEQHMGKPLYHIPVPPLEKSGINIENASKEEIADLKKAKNFAELYAIDFMHAFKKLGCTQEIVWSHELYESRKMDDAIRTALDSVETMRKIYKEVADYELPPKWFPFQVICEKCGKLGTTLVTDWDGEHVTYECQPNKVTWAAGCNNTGKVSPFGGRGKLLWKVDWPAHWKTLGVTVEGAGKDHTSAGGSRDMANAQCKEVFHIPVPFNAPYEWILIRGTKMSSSKGVGTSAREFVELFPQEVGRFLFTDRVYSQVIDFDPATMAIPDLFDEFDQAARIYWKEAEGDQRLARSFELAHTAEIPTAHFLPRFRDVALWMQYPEINLKEKFAEIKGSALTKQEQEVLKERKQYAKIWVDRYAPAEYQFTPREDLPEAARSLTPEQIQFLAEIIVYYHKDLEITPEDFQQYIFQTAKDSIGAKQGFEAIYLAFLGKKAGPRAAWLLQSLSSELRKKRVEDLRELGSKEVQYKYQEINTGELLTIDKDLASKYPSLIIGVAIIKGIKIKESSEALKIEIQNLYDSVKNISNDQINESPFIQSYRKAIKQSGIDWHSRRPTMEALLRRISKGNVPRFINNVADIGNMLAVKHQMSQGLFDVNKISTPITFKEAKGGEKVQLFGEAEETVLKTGEICYYDQEGPFAIDLCWRDAVRTSVTDETVDLLIQTEGVFEIQRKDVENMLSDLIDHLTEYAGGKLETVGIITAQGIK